MWPRHVVVKALGQAAHHAGGVVVLHLHATQRVGRIAADALEHGRHACGVLGHLQGEVDDVHQLVLHAVHGEGGEGLGDIGHITVGFGTPVLARAQGPVAVHRHNPIARNNLGAGRQATVVHHGAHRTVEHALHRADLATDAHPPGHARAALPGQHVVGELAILQRAQGQLDDAVIDQHRHGRQALVLQVLHVHAHGLQLLTGAVAMEDPHFVLVVVRDVDGLRALAGAVGPFLEGLGDGLTVVALVLEQLHQLAPAEVVALPGVAAVVDVLATGRVRKEIPEVDALAGSPDLFKLDLLDDASDRVFGRHPDSAQHRERPLEHARATASGVLDQLAHLTVPVRFHQPVLNLPLHLLGSFLGSLDLPLHEVLHGLLVIGKAHGFAQLRNQSRAQLGDGRGLDLPGAVVRGQQHVGHPGAGRIHIGPGDVQEHHRPGGAYRLGRRSDGLLAAVQLVAGLERPVGIIDALVVLLVLGPLSLNAGAHAALDGFVALGQQRCQELGLVIHGRFSRIVGLQAPCFVSGCLHVSTQFHGLRAPSHRPSSARGPVW